MEVLNVNISLDAVTGGGTAERTFQMTRFLMKAGARCSVLTTDVGLTQERRKALSGVEVLAYPCLSRRFYIPKFSYREIQRLVERADDVHLMNHWTFLNALVYFIVRRVGKPYVVCPAGALRIYGRSKLLKRMYNWAVGKKIIRNARYCIAIGHSEIEQIQSYGVAKDRVRLIPNGIAHEDIPDCSRSEGLDRYGLQKMQFILFVGRLNAIKGPDLLLRAFCNLAWKLPNYHMVFVGPDGGMLALLKKIVRQAGIGNRVHFLGYLGGQEKYRAYCGADLLVIPSRYEAMSIVVLEAGVVGTPVLLTDKCGFDDIVDSHGAYIVPASVAGIQNGLVEMLSDASGLRTKGEGLKNYVCEHFTWNCIVNKYIDLYKQIVPLHS